MEPDSPYLYRLVTKLRLAKDGRIIESIAQNIGFREIVLDPDSGLVVNGRNEVEWFVRAP